MDMTRQEKIRILEEHLKILNVDKGIEFEKEIEALKYAINSLKTDESYQLMYEGGEIFTKADMVAMLEELQAEIEEKAIRKQGVDSGFEYDYEFIQSEEVVDIIQQKICKLKAEIEPQESEDKE